MKTEIEKVENEQDGTPSDLIRLAITSGANLEQLEKVLALKERYEANEARKAYHKAMADFKANPPEISKDSHVKYQTSKGVTEYNHATLANVCEKINGGLSQHGLSSSWITKQDEKGKIGVTTKITHELGHSEETTLWAGADDTGSKNSIQAIGSTITYLQRYGLLALTGLATKEQDDDGKTSDIEYITDEQSITLSDYLLATNTDEAKFLAWLKVESLDKLPKDQYMKALNALKAKESKK